MVKRTLEEPALWNLEGRLQPLCSLASEPFVNRSWSRSLYFFLPQILKFFTAVELGLGSVFTGFVLIGQRGATMGGEVLTSVDTAPTT